MKRREKGTVILVPAIEKPQMIFPDLIHPEGQGAPKPRVLTMIETRAHMLGRTLPSPGYRRESKPLFRSLALKLLLAFCRKGSEGAPEQHFEHSKKALVTTSQAISKGLGLTRTDTHKVTVR